MQFKDISQDEKTTYRLAENEQSVFFVLNRGGAITFELAGRGAQAYIFSFFVGNNSDKISLHIKQNHLAPQTTSHTLVKSIISDEAECAYEGVIFIDKKAPKSNASQESRALLLSSSAKASMKPTLEILASDVICHHAATASPLNKEALFFAQSRGLSTTRAKTLLTRGFFHDALLKIEAFGIDTGEITTQLNKYLQQL